MLKYKIKKYKTSFTKKNFNWKIFKYKNKNTIFLKNKIQLQIKVVLKFLKKIKKRFRKRRIFFWFNCRSNFIKSYKSKNSRMGKGKGQSIKYTIRHLNRKLGSFKNLLSSSFVLKKKLKKWGH